MVKEKKTLNFKSVLLLLFFLIGLLATFGCTLETTTTIIPEEETKPFMDVPEWLQGYWAVAPYSESVPQTVFMKAEEENIFFPELVISSLHARTEVEGLELKILESNSSTFSFHLWKEERGFIIVDEYYTFTKKSDDRVNYFRTDGILSIDVDLNLHRVKIKVTFNKNGGTMSSSNASRILTFGKPFEGVYPNINKEGHEFAGWSLTKNDLDTLITSESFAEFNSNTTVYALWTPNEYIIRFDSQGGSEVDAISVTFGEPYWWPWNQPESILTSKTFLGWFTEKNGEGDEITSDTVFTITGDQTLYAAWLNAFIGPAGGFVFYENPNHEKDGWRYLEAAPAGWSGETEDPRYMFGHYRPDGANNEGVGTATGIGEGRENTLALIVAMGDEAYSDSLSDSKAVYAAKVASEYSVTVDEVIYDDWFLPSINELNEMFKAFKGSLHLIGFSLDYYSSKYWSSSEYSNRYAWRQYFEHGNQHYDSRSIKHRVRPVRAY